MVVAYAQEFTVGIFTSPDLKAWSHASNFSHQGLLGLEYECPNLVPMPLLANSSLPASQLLSPANFVPDANLYLLLISLNPSAPLGGSISQYFPGAFNGMHFTAVDGAARIADFGKDNYAGQFFYRLGDGEPQVSIAWTSNWEYSQVVPSGEREGWGSSMTLPRWNVLARDAPRAGWSLVSLSYGGLGSVSVGVGRAGASTIGANSSGVGLLASNPNLGNGSMLLDFRSVPSNAIAFTATLANIPTAAPNTTVTGTLNFTLLASTTGESLRGGFFLGGDAPFFLDRGNVQGFDHDDPFFTDKVSVSAPVDPPTGRWDVQVVVDRSLLEVFLDNERRSATLSFFPDGVLDTLMVRAGGLNEGVMVGVEVWGLESAWVGMGGGNGTVVGNGTSEGVGRRWERL